MNFIPIAIIVFTFD